MQVITKTIDYKMTDISAYKDKIEIYFPHRLCFKEGKLRQCKRAHVRKLFSILVTVMLLVACGKDASVLQQMDIAENLMETKPDSALAVLESIPASDVNGKEMAARYALLKSMALDKNSIDTTEFDVLQPAIDYYIKKRNFR